MSADISDAVSGSPALNLEGGTFGCLDCSLNLSLAETGGTMPKKKPEASCLVVFPSGKSIKNNLGSLSLRQNLLNLTKPVCQGS
jgi:hypothetical protein